MTYELDKNSWIAKLTFKTWCVSEKDFTHICPFFWLAVFTVLILPISLLIISIMWGIKTYDEIRKQNKQQFNAWARTYLDWIKSDEKAKQSFLDNFYKNEKGQLYRFYDWLFYQDFKLYEEANNILHNYKIEKEDKKEAKDRKRKDMIAKAVVYTKPVSKFILYCLAIVTIAGLGYALEMVISYLLALPSTSWKEFFVMVGKVVLAAILIVATISGLGAYFKRKDNLVSKVGGFFYRIGSSICNFISLFFQENCPPVKWK